MEPFAHKVRRVVTGHDDEDMSIIVLDDEPTVTPLGNDESSRVLVEVWATIANDAVGPSFDMRKDAHPGELGPNASEIRVVDMPPGSRREMHRTDTIDYGIVIAGEVHLILERSETLLRCGDIVIQRGTSHSWHNKSADVARVVFVNMRGQVTDHERCPHV
jgi:quercetin dioxygenase-like cupin family protein